MRIVFFISFIVFPFFLFSQDCKILGKTEPFSFVIIQGSSLNTTSNELGEFELNRLPPGLYNIEISALGFEKKIVYEVETTR